MEDRSSQLLLLGSDTEAERGGWGDLVIWSSLFRKEKVPDLSACMAIVCMDLACMIAEADLEFHSASFLFACSFARLSVADLALVILPNLSLTSSIAVVEQRDERKKYLQRQLQ